MSVGVLIFIGHLTKLSTQHHFCFHGPPTHPIQFRNGKELPADLHQFAEEDTNHEFKMLSGFLCGQVQIDLRVTYEFLVFCLRYCYIAETTQQKNSIGVTLNNAIA